MADDLKQYTIVNLEQVEDMAPQFGFAPDLEARYARKPLALENAGLSLFRLAPGFRVPFGHRHGEQEEVYVVLRGSMRIKLEDDVVELKQWDAVRVPGATTRGMEGGPDGVEYLAFGAPNTDNKDAEKVPGWWDD